MTAKQIAVKRYVVKLSDDERKRLDTLIHAGKHSARLLTKARILLKADASEVGEGWSDSPIAAALDTSIDTVARTRQQLVEEGLEAVLIRKHSPASCGWKTRRWHSHILECSTTPLGDTRPNPSRGSSRSSPAGPVPRSLPQRTARGGAAAATHQPMAASGSPCRG